MSVVPGAVSKDGSSLVIVDSSIRGAHVAEIMAYIKKPEYGPADHRRSAHTARHRWQRLAGRPPHARADRSLRSRALPVGRRSHSGYPRWCAGGAGSAQRAFPNFKRKPNTPRLIVLEIKCAKADRDRASRAIQRLPLRMSRHCKYVVGMGAILGL
jgi:hypothetical protein